MAQIGRAALRWAERSRCSWRSLPLCCWSGYLCRASVERSFDPRQTFVPDEPHAAEITDSDWNGDRCRGKGVCLSPARRATTNWASRTAGRIIATLWISSGVSWPFA